MTQKAQVLSMLRDGPKTTADFCSTPGLAAEYRRAISELRREYVILAECVRRGCWKYRLWEAE